MGSFDSSADTGVAGVLPCGVYGACATTAPACGELIGIPGLRSMPDASAYLIGVGAGIIWTGV